ncbi:AbrB family transcriptional regulator [Flexistipes sinusarabici]|uniref:AbrB family transcriptional regulator n=1 Tax=Flexistipes sinusarabici TaxID=2352 RepID=UPI0023528D4D|nr:AbrB family transcriptional regulator [Flexistipes sinusarabici]
MSLLVVVMGGIAGAFLAVKLSVPGGAIVGAMLGSGIFSILSTTKIVIPEPVNFTIQVALGIMIGTSMDKDLLKVASKIVPIAIVGSLIFIAVGVLIALFVYKLGFLDFTTALLGFTPGAMSSVLGLAISLKAKLALVATIQVIRVIMLVILIPLIVKIIL